MSYINIVLVLFILVLIFIFLKRILSFNHSKDNLILKEILRVAYTSEIVEEAGLKIIDILSKYYRFDYCTLFKFNVKRNRLEEIATTVNTSYISDLLDMANTIHEKSKTNSDAYIETSNVPLQYKSTLKRNIKYIYFIPLSINNQTIGGLLIERKEEDKKNKVESEFFKIVTETITLALQNLMYFEKVTNSSYIDGLTEIYNRKYLDLYLPKKIKSYSQQDTSFSIVMFDIDHFKKFNDTYGHQFGDLVLRELSSFISKNLRENDVLFRYGGEEFTIFMPNIDGDMAFKRIDDIRNKIKNLVLRSEDGTTASVTCSFGVVGYTSNEDELKDYIEKADKALYYSKNNGRNRVTLFDEEKVE